MSEETREFCDCCNAQITKDGKLLDAGDTIYRRRVRSIHFPYWPRNAPVEIEWALICGKCWKAIGKTVSEAREAASV